MIARMKVKIASLPLKRYAWIANAVIAEKYVVSTAHEPDTITEFRSPLATGSVPCNTLYRLRPRKVLGRSVNPFVSSA